MNVEALEENLQHMDLGIATIARQVSETYTWRVDVKPTGGERILIPQSYNAITLKEAIEIAQVYAHEYNNYLRITEDTK